VVAAEDSNFTRFIAGFRRIALLPPLPKASPLPWPVAGARERNYFSKSSATKLLI
jgi:hypothetical protein